MRKVEKKIDSLSSTEIGQELVAMLGLSARSYLSVGRQKKFMEEFCREIGVTGTAKVATAIINYLYPPNPNYWFIQDDIFRKQVKESMLIKANKQTKKKGRKDENI